MERNTCNHTIDGGARQIRELGNLINHHPGFNRRISPAAGHCVRANLGRPRENSPHSVGRAYNAMEKCRVRPAALGPNAPTGSYLACGYADASAETCSFAGCEMRLFLLLSFFFILRAKVS